MTYNEKDILNAMRDPFSHNGDLDDDSMVPESRKIKVEDANLAEDIEKEIDDIEAREAEIEKLDKSHPSMKQLQEEIATLKTTLEESRDKLLRAHAEMDNIRRRARTDVEKAHKYALENFIKDLLPIIDSLEKALEAGSEHEAAQAHAEGVELTLKMFAETLKKYGVKVIDPLGEPFNPELHEAVSILPNAEVEPNTVLQVLQKGYELNGRLIRPAMVIVAK